MKTKWSSIGFTVMAAAVLVSSGCGKSGTADGSATNAGTEKLKPVSVSSASPSPAIAKRPSLASKVVAARDTGAITGWVVYQGTPPKPKTINFGPEKVCGDLNRDRPALYETLVVNPNGTIKGALVAIRGKVAGNYPGTKEPVVVDQVACTFVPHVVAMVLGQEIEFRNSDPVSHNIRGTPTRNTIFNSLFATKSVVKSKFDSPEIGIPLKCDIHYWMSAYVHVLPHPFFAITGDDGSFVISGVPPGDYTLFAWHESFKMQTRAIKVIAGEAKELEFTWASGG